MICDIKKPTVRHQQLFIKNLFDRENKCSQKIQEKCIQCIVYKTANLLIVSILALYAETRIFLCTIREKKPCSLT